MASSVRSSDVRHQTTTQCHDHCWLAGSTCQAGWNATLRCWNMAGPRSTTWAAESVAAVCCFCCHQPPLLAADRRPGKAASGKGSQRGSGCQQGSAKRSGGCSWLAVRQVMHCMLYADGRQRRQARCRSWLGGAVGWQRQHQSQQYCNKRHAKQQQRGSPGVARSAGAFLAGLPPGPGLGLGAKLRHHVRIPLERILGCLGCCGRSCSRLGGCSLRLQEMRDRCPRCLPQSGRALCCLSF